MIVAFSEYLHLHFYKVDNFCDFLFAFLHKESLLKRFYSKRKEFAPGGSKFLLFRVDRFAVGEQNNFDIIESVSMTFSPYHSLDKFSRQIDDIFLAFFFQFVF